MSPEAAPDRNEACAAAERLVRTYLDLWNAGDIRPIWAHCYADDAQLPWDRTVMEAARALLDQQDFASSRIEALRVQPVGPGHVDVRLRFTRLTRAGAVLPPGTRETLYVVRLRPEGWRITAMHPVA